MVTGCNLLIPLFVGGTVLVKLLVRPGVGFSRPGSVPLDWRRKQLFYSFCCIDQVPASHGVWTFPLVRSSAFPCPIHQVKDYNPADFFISYSLSCYIPSYHCWLSFSCFGIFPYSSARYMQRAGRGWI